MKVGECFEFRTIYMILLIINLTIKFYPVERKYNKFLGSLREIMDSQWLYNSTQDRVETQIT